MSNVIKLERVLDTNVLIARDVRTVFMTNHPKDHHVAAATVHAGADIVTSNLRDFRPADLAPFGIRAVHRDDFLIELTNAAPDAMADVLRDLLTEPPYQHLTAEGLLHRLERTVPRFAVAKHAYFTLSTTVTVRGFGVARRGRARYNLPYRRTQADTARHPVGAVKGRKAA